MSHIDEIIVIRAADPDGSVFKAIIAMLQEKKAEVIDVTTSASSALFLGDLEIRPNYRQVLVADKEVSLNHSEYAMKRQNPSIGRSRTVSSAVAP